VWFLPVADSSGHFSLDAWTHPRTSSAVSPGAPADAQYFGCGDRNIFGFFVFVHFGGDLAVSCRNSSFWPPAPATVWAARWFELQDRRDLSDRSAAFGE